MRRIGWVLVGSLAWAACSKKPPPAPVAPAEVLAEVEISGLIHCDVPGAVRVMVFLDKGPCNGGRPEFKPIGLVSEDPAQAQRYFMEVFVPQGSQGFLCGAAFNQEGRLVGWGASDKNPLTFAGKGEVEHHLDVTVKPLHEDLPHPKGLPEVGGPKRP